MVECSALETDCATNTETTSNTSNVVSSTLRDQVPAHLKPDAREIPLLEECHTRVVECLTVTSLEMS
jgi:hypothetical protein